LVETYLVTVCATAIDLGGECDYAVTTVIPLTAVPMAGLCEGHERLKVKERDRFSHRKMFPGRSAWFEAQERWRLRL